MSVSGSAGTLAILADSNGNGNGILLFTGSAVAGISGCTGGVTTVSLTGNDIELDPYLPVQLRLLVLDRVIWLSLNRLLAVARMV